MQTILGANGQIANELAKALKLNYTSDIRLVSRNPTRVNNTDKLLAADLTDKKKAFEAVAGSEIAYFTLGLPMNAAMWQKQFPLILRNIIDACKQYETKLVFFDNTYMYPQDNRILTEKSTFAPVGEKGKVRQVMVEMLLREMETNQIEAVICRAPEFYGPGKTQSITNTMIFDAIKQQKKLKVPLKDNKRRSLIWTPDASRAMALIGNTPDAYGQTWHLPVDTDRPTYKELIALASEVYEEELSYMVIPKFILKLGSLISKPLRELQELLPRYEYDNLFDTSKFMGRFPDFAVTTYRQGIEIIHYGQISYEMN